MGQRIQKMGTGAKREKGQKAKGQKAKRAKGKTSRAAKEKNIVKVTRSHRSNGAMSSKQTKAKRPELREVKGECIWR